jgi:DNA-binding MarR family transcriptional regulator
MIREWTRTPEGDAATDIVLETFRASGLLLAAGNRLAAQEGLTAARWQVLGAVALAGRPLTVPQIARRMGLTRQAVQASVNRLLGEALAETSENLDHRRSPLIRLTGHGSQKYAALDRRQIRWINELSAGLEISDLVNAARLLHDLSDRLENRARAGRRRNDDDDAT